MLSPSHESVRSAPEALEPRGNPDGGARRGGGERGRIGLSRGLARTLAGGLGGLLVGLLGTGGVLLGGRLARAEPPAVQPAAATAATPSGAETAPARPAAAADGQTKDEAHAPKARPKPVLDPRRVVQTSLKDTGPGAGVGGRADGARPAGAASGAAAEPATPGVARRVGPAGGKVRLPLAPSAAEIERERAAQRTEGGDAGSGGQAGPPPTGSDRLQQRATTTPTQDRRWPTSSPNTQGAGGSLGPRTLSDRKAALQDASGPQQGVIRNRW